MLCVAVVGLTAADAELYAEQTLTAPALAAMIIAVLNIFVNFILILFLVCWLHPSRMALISSRGETSSWKEFAQADAGLRL